MGIIIILSLTAIIYWVLTIMSRSKERTFTAGSIAIIFTVFNIFAIIVVISMSNPFAKEIKDLQDKRENIVYGLENTTNEYLYASLYKDAQKFNADKQCYETMKNSLLVGWFQDKRYKYVDYIDLKKERRTII